MSNEFFIKATSRSDEGKGASRRLRHNNLVPAVIYGANQAPASLTVELKEITKALENEAFYSHILTVEIDGSAEQAILRDLQRHPAKNHVTHIDFQRVDANQKIHVKVPLHFVNEAESVGVKQQGGNIHHDLSEVELVCLPKDLPEFIEVDMIEVTAGQSLHLSDLNLPEGVEAAALIQGEGHNLSVVSISKPKGGASDDDAAEEEAAE